MGTGLSGLLSFDIVILSHTPECRAPPQCVDKVLELHLCGFHMTLGVSSSGSLDSGVAYCCGVVGGSSGRYILSKMVVSCSNCPAGQQLQKLAVISAP